MVRKELGADEASTLARSGFCLAKLSGRSGWQMAELRRADSQEFSPTSSFLGKHYPVREDLLPETGSRAVIQRPITAPKPVPLRPEAGC
jgi:hypothetical protein